MLFIFYALLPTGWSKSITVFHVSGSIQSKEPLLAPGSSIQKV